MGWHNFMTIAEKAKEPYKNAKNGIGDHIADVDNMVIHRHIGGIAHHIKLNAHTNQMPPLSHCPLPHQTAPVSFALTLGMIYFSKQRNV